MKREPGPEVIGNAEGTGLVFIVFDACLSSSLRDRGPASSQALGASCRIGLLGSECVGGMGSLSRQLAGMCMSLPRNRDIPASCSAWNRALQPVSLEIHFKMSRQCLPSPATRWWAGGLGVSCHCSSFQDGENQGHQGCDWAVLLLAQKFPRLSR